MKRNHADFSGSNNPRYKGGMPHCKGCNKLLTNYYSTLCSIHYLESRKGKYMAEKAPAWKGDNASYNAIHAWINKQLFKPKECSYCGSDKKLEWASIGHKAKRDLDDYIPLCKKCHNNYDEIGRKSWEARRLNYL